MIQLQRVLPLRDFPSAWTRNQCDGSGKLHVRHRAGCNRKLMNQTERRYELLYGDELFDLIRGRPLAWLPLGILERHGAHLPWGLDGLKAHAVCLRLAERFGGVVLPATHLAGIHGDCRGADQSEFRRRHAAIGDLLYREETFRTFLYETFDGLANLGFRVIVAYTGHYPKVQTRILTEVAE